MEEMKRLRIWVTNWNQQNPEFHSLQPLNFLIKKCLAIPISACNVVIPKGFCWIDPEIIRLWLAQLLGFTGWSRIQVEDIWDSLSLCHRNQDRHERTRVGWNIFYGAHRSPIQYSFGMCHVYPCTISNAPRKFGRKQMWPMLWEDRWGECSNDVCVFWYVCLWNLEDDENQCPSLETHLFSHWTGLFSGGSC